MRLLLSKSARQEYDTLKSDAPEIAEKVKSILKDTIAHPDTGAGVPTKLEGTYSGLWQRYFAPGQVIIYSFDDEAVTVASIGSRDTVLKRIQLESYSEKDEQSVMSQMAANRGKDGQNAKAIYCE